MVAGIALGDFPIGPATIIDALLGRAGRADTYVVTQLRRPRAVTALAVGG